MKRRAHIIFTVKQVSPQCRSVGHFSVRGHRGLNRVRFTGRVGRKQLSPGTYRITARTRSGRVVDRVIIVVVNRGAPTKADLAAARAANVCTSGIASFAANSIGASEAGLAFAGGIGGSLGGTPGSGSGPAKGSNSHSGTILAAAVEQAARALQPLLIALLGAAIILLGLASLPRVALVEPRLGEALAKHRVELAALGAAALVAVVITFLVD